MRSLRAYERSDPDMFFCARDIVATEFKSLANQDLTAIVPIASILQSLDGALGHIREFKRMARADDSHHTPRCFVPRCRTLQIVVETLRQHIVDEYLFATEQRGICFMLAYGFGMLTTQPVLTDDDAAEEWYRLAALVSASVLPGRRVSGTRFGPVTRDMHFVWKSFYKAWPGCECDLCENLRERGGWEG